MSEEEKSESIIQEIKDIYLYLTQGEPTPDDEITAREKLIEKIQILKTVNSFLVESNMVLLEETLEKLEDWDTLDLWFVESELPSYIQKIISITSEVPEFQIEKEIKETPATRMHEDLETASFDIDQIVDKVSEQFKGEIEDLKHKIDVLKTELERKDDSLKELSHNRVIKKITPKKDVKLPPPKIKLPVTKKPDQPPQVKAPTKPETERYTKPIGIKSTIEEVQAKIEEEIEKLKGPLEEKYIQKPQPQAPTVPKGSDSILEIIEESEAPKPPSEPPNFTQMPEKPSKSTLVPEIIEVEPLEEETKIPFTIKEPKIIGKSEITSKPKITEVSIEEIEAEEIRSTGTELFNVFSSVGEKSDEKLPTLNEAFSSLPLKDKKKKKEEKTDTIAFVGFRGPQSEISYKSESEAEIDDKLPSDKDSLYQELIALEGKRYSLEKTFKDLEKTYSTGSIDDSEYKKQSDGLRGKLNGITSKINKIRRVISSL